MANGKSLKAEVGDEIFAIFVAILFFHSIPNLPQVGEYFKKYPLIVFGIAVVLLVFRKQILNVFGAAK